MTKLNITINSRVYTVVADEEIEYLERLCNYVNDKVKLVINEGNHVMGEKPIVLAALNICDEYFKLLDASAPQEKFSEVIAKNRQLEEEIWDEEQRFVNPHRHFMDMTPDYYELKMGLLHGLRS